MPTSCFLLGPDQWDDGHTPATPDWFDGELRERRPSNYQPWHLRLHLKRILERDHGRKATLMDPSAQHEGETEGDFLRRLEIANHVDTYIIVLPAHTKVLGTVFEGGMLERDFHYGKNPRILLFLQTSYAGKDRHDHVRFKEKGKRTRYLESLAKRAHHVDFWDETADLIDLVVEWATLE